MRDRGETISYLLVVRYHRPHYLLLVYCIICLLYTFCYVFTSTSIINILLIWNPTQLHVLSPHFPNVLVYLSSFRQPILSCNTHVKKCMFETFGGYSGLRKIQETYQKNPIFKIFLQ